MHGMPRSLFTSSSERKAEEHDAENTGCDPFNIEWETQHKENVKEETSFLLASEMKEREHEEMQRTVACSDERIMLSTHEEISAQGGPFGREKSILEKENTEKPEGHWENAMPSHAPGGVWLSQVQAHLLGRQGRKAVEWEGPVGTCSHTIDIA
ncbi:hypothetical protein NDU88_012066 [Pleurodeles waltl]|uniref:Uncharacterized protein n=1 Tax=Pleurodeles waltl TaxID=8319 RepID=A0AAV7QZ40_PLEWA|nr:hypothetical protein NDU88_012066 [Pleurodeles waltl]